MLKETNIKQVPKVADLLKSREKLRRLVESKRFDYEDLFTVFKLLDGERRTDYANTFAVCAERDLKESDTVEAGYFTVKCYKNGNQLVTINRLDLLETFNKYGADPSGLPDYMKKRYKPEHFEQAETLKEEYLDCVAGDEDTKTEILKELHVLKGGDVNAHDHQLDKTTCFTMIFASLFYSRFAGNNGKQL